MLGRVWWKMKLFQVGLHLYRVTNHGELVGWIERWPQAKWIASLKIQGSWSGEKIKTFEADTKEQAATYLVNMCGK